MKKKLNVKRYYLNCILLVNLFLYSPLILSVEYVKKTFQIQKINYGFRIKI